MGSEPVVVPKDSKACLGRMGSLHSGDHVDLWVCQGHMGSGLAVVLVGQMACLVRMDSGPVVVHEGLEADEVSRGWWTTGVRKGSMASLVLEVFMRSEVHMG